MFRLGKAEDAAQPAAELAARPITESQRDVTGDQPAAQPAAQPARKGPAASDARGPKRRRSDPDGRSSPQSKADIVAAMFSRHPSQKDGSDEVHVIE